MKGKGATLRKPALPITAFPLRVQLQKDGVCFEVKYAATDVKKNEAGMLQVKGPAAASGGGCQVDGDCARPDGTSACGPNATCTPTGQCVDPDQSGNFCNPENPPGPPFPGGCTSDFNCVNTVGCGAGAQCGPNQYCGDPDEQSISQPCSTDADCPGGTDGQPMVCLDGTTCADLCGATRCPFVTATIPAVGGLINGDNTGGTSVINASCGGTGGRERTYLWTPTTSGMATIETCGTGYDTVLSLRTGDCTTGTQVACNDDSACGLQSQMTPMVTAGTTYTIVVDGYDGGDVGPFTLTVTPPP